MSESPVIWLLFRVDPRVMLTLVTSSSPQFRIDPE